MVMIANAPEKIEELAREAERRKIENEQLQKRIEELLRENKALRDELDNTKKNIVNKA